MKRAYYHVHLIHGLLLGILLITGLILLIPGLRMLFIDYRHEIRQFHIIIGIIYIGFLVISLPQVIRYLRSHKWWQKTFTENFQFEVYFQPELIFIYDNANGMWRKSNYSHPVAGELEGLRDPFIFWFRMLKHTESVRRHTDPNGIIFESVLKPFRDEVHGIRIEEVERAYMQVRLTNPSNKVEQIKLQIELKNNIIRGFDRIVYSVDFTNINSTEMVGLPPDARFAKPMN